MTRPRGRTSLHVLDDDPTGTQAATGVPVVTSWLNGEPTTIPDDAVVYHLTNTRSLSPQHAERRVATVARRVIELSGKGVTPQFVLRGDSTLRGHVLEEFNGLTSAVPQPPTTLVLVPAMPEAGRVTRNGVHFALDPESSRYVPIAETAYALDPRLGFVSSRLVDWAEERSHGRFRADRSVEVHLKDLRIRGEECVTAALGGAAGSERSVVAIDAETEADLVTIARGLRHAFDAGLPIAVRTAPPLAALLGNRRAHRLESIPRARRVLVICGSFVPLSTRQLDVLTTTHPRSSVVVGINELMAIDAGSPDTLAASVAAIEAIWHHSAVAIVATPRAAPPSGSDFDESASAARGLAGIVGALRPRPELIVSKGGSTSAHVVQYGFLAGTATVVGPVASGVALWRVDGASILVVPGNVGPDSLLDDLVAAALSLSLREP